MSKKRVTITDNSRNQPYEAKVLPGTFKKRGKEYVCYRVQGWKEDGKWAKVQYSKESDAIEFARQKNIELLNHGRKMVLVTSELDQDQTIEAEQAFKNLGEYSLSDAVQFYLDHHRAADFQIRFSDGLKHYLDHKERKGVREPTRKRVRAMLDRFKVFSGDPLVHTITNIQVEGFLNSLRASDGKLAKRKTFNNYRNELASFFKWARNKDLATNRPWTFNDPLNGIEAHSSDRVAEQRPEISTTATGDVQRLMSYVMGYKEGKLAKWFALAYFAGIRPSTDQGELTKLAEREDELINLNTGVINLPASVTKTKKKRQIRMPANLLAWMKAYEGKSIAPANLKNDYRHVREKFNLQADEPRHSFISYHVALNRSIGDAALQAGNSERMIEGHYLNLHAVDEGKDFFSIVPDIKAGEAIISEIKPDSKITNYKAS